MEDSRIPKLILHYILKLAKQNEEVKYMKEGCSGKKIGTENRMEKDNKHWYETINEEELKEGMKNMRRERMETKISMDYIVY